MNSPATHDHRFVVDGEELMIGGVGIRRLVERIGSTPFYAIERHALSRRVASLRRHLPIGVSIHYAIKANPMPALVCHMARLVDGLDVASAGELGVALDAGMPAAQISFAGPGKRASELHQAVAAGVLVNLESPAEIEPLRQAGIALGLTPRVAVRINPDFALKGSGMRMGGGPRPFGVDAEAVPQLLRQIEAAGLTFEGFHIYWGSQNLSAQQIARAQRSGLDLALRLADETRCELKSLNLGGGFGIPYFAGDAALDLAPIGEAINEVLIDLHARHPGCGLILELGRYLVGEAGVYVCRVLDRKISRGQVFLITDGGLHHHLAASGNFGQVIRRNFPLALATRMHAPSQETVNVVGPLCTPLDVLGDQVSLPQAAPGDLVVLFQSGAYGLTASPSAFLSHPMAREVLV